MNRFVALREQRSNAGQAILPGDFVPELEGAPVHIQISNINQCMAFDLDGKIKIDPYERQTLRAQAALVSNVELQKGCSIFDLRKEEEETDENPASEVLPTEQNVVDLENPATVIEPMQQAAAQDAPAQEPKNKGGRKKKQ